VLRRYAADTKKIAQASVAQTENNQMPFVALVEKYEAGWSVENRGFGCALNIRHTDPTGKGAGLVTSYIDSLAKDEAQVLTGFYPEMIKQKGFTSSTNP
jgi:hypothetical protein